jgi:class 3 adenylate cyclase
MSLKPPSQKKSFLNKLPGSSPSLKFWVIVPIFIMLVLSLVAVVGLAVITRQSLPPALPLVSVASFLAVVGIALLITRQIVRRLDRIIEAAEQVSQGDFSIRIEDGHSDEIGHLVRAFNNMVADLDHLHQSRDLLSRTLSPAVRESLIENGLDFRGITQEVSILFIDMMGFTPLTERCHPEQLVFFLNDYYTSIANQVHGGGGIIGKYGGDSILAFFGAPRPESPAKSSTAALLTALALQGTIEELSQRWELLGFPPIRVGMGLSFGPVMMGPIGSEAQFEYTVIGDAVNLAARLQDLTRNLPGYGIVIGTKVYQELENWVRDQIKIVSLEHYEALASREKARQPILFVDLGYVLVKGKKGPIHVYAIPDYEYPESEGKLPEKFRLFPREAPAKGNHTQKEEE